MPGPADVRSIESLELFRGQILEFAEKAKEEVASAEWTIMRSLDWLQGQLAHWRGEQRRAEEAVHVAMEELTMRRIMMSAAKTHDTTEAEIALRRAKARLAQIEDKMERTRLWMRELPDESKDLRGALHRVRNMLDADVPNMATFLKERVDRLEAYRQT
ncbi:MAG: hypothetical protein K2X38_05380 [Gemmataceae bacterium]|nr:hypothetical protein [Gemmataceae bacterium]